ncbi:SRPBCC domain-containing protein [Streptomyces sp. XD-27]|uniref:SRPBCC family protein n=1 Tax=Streptomyces sp. XD-27 TaxID=3062779 RepID=UPI00350E3B3F
MFVALPVDTVRRALADPARIARSIPGLQQDADDSAGPIAGRLRLRIGGHTITYRGTLRVAERDGVFEAEVEAAEARGDGGVKAALTVVPTAADGGTRLACSASARSEGRLAEYDTETAEAVARRVLDRFAANLAAGLTSDSPEGAAAGNPPEAVAEDPGAGNPPAGEARATAPDDVAPDDDTAPDDVTADGGDTATEFGGDAERPPPARDPLSADDGDGADDGAGADEGHGGDEDGAEYVPGLDAVGDLAGVDGVDGVDPLDGLDGEPPAEAAHARRTMIGRSTEEVDHAPPRGRYAPVPAPDTAPGGVALRWAAPAAAFVLASAVVVGRRVLRRRR